MIQVRTATGRGFDSEGSFRRRIVGQARRHRGERLPIGAMTRQIRQYAHEEENPSS